MQSGGSYLQGYDCKLAVDSEHQVIVAVGMSNQPQRGPLPRDADAKTRMARKLRSRKGSRIYAQRKAIVEPVNGQIKEGRGLRRFLLRGLEKVDGEWHLVACTHNLLKLPRNRRSQQKVQWAATV